MRPGHIKDRVRALVQFIDKPDVPQPGPLGATARLTKPVAAVDSQVSWPQNFGDLDGNLYGIASYAHEAIATAIGRRADARSTRLIRSKRARTEWV